jgi:hypothetical protein
MASAMGLVVPAEAELRASKYADSFLLLQYWRVVWAVPIFLAIIMGLLMLTVFRYETPVTMKSSSDWDTLTQLMSRMYEKNTIQGRIDAIEVAAKTSDGSGEKVSTGPSLKDSFFDPKIRRAAWVGCSLSMF